MAVYAAHLTRTLQGAPSVFQVTAQEALGATVKPALRKVVEYLAAAYPNKCGWCLTWYDELHLLFDYCLQYYYLKHYAASFSESFYGLLRVPTGAPGEFSLGGRLPRHLEQGSLALLVVVPYLKDKLEKIVDRWREDDEDGRLGKGHGDRARRAAVRVYSVAHLAWEGLRLLQLARYLTAASLSHSPAMASLGLALKDAPEPRGGDGARWGDLLRSLRGGRIGDAALGFPLLALVEYGAFGVQFLRWWQGAALADTDALPAPQAPQRDERSARWRNRCPLCLQAWSIPTVLPVSGYIFCYICISRHLRANAYCPVTRCPAVEQSLVRLYID